MDDHTLQQVIDLAVKTAVLKAKKEAILECRPIGSYFITETEDDPNILFGGGWQKLTGRYVLQCSDDSHKAGTTVQAGLPNITGSFTVVGDSGDEYTWASSIRGQGAFYDIVVNNKRQYFAHCVYNDIDGTYNQAFDASRSNSIYGNSDTVQPPARIVNVWKRVS